jgi:hypothetical protein
MVSERRVVGMWSRAARTASRLLVADGEGPPASASMSLFRGRGDFVFHHRDIFRASLKSLTLHLERTGMSFDFTWRFTDDDEAVALTARNGSRTQR